MTQEAKTNNLKRIFLFGTGIATLVLGIALILHFWEQLACLFKGGIGVVLALSGIALLFIAKE